MQEVVVPPSSPEAEIGILQTVVFDNSALDTLTLQPEDFYTEEHQRGYCQVMEHACPTLPPDARFVACSGLYSGCASHLRQK